MEYSATTNKLYYENWIFEYLILLTIVYNM